MYVIAVEFEIDEAQMDAFMPLMRNNASASRTKEPGCRQFDVSVDPQRRSFVFLYELYDDEAAFDAHLASDHFKRFDAATEGMIQRRQVRTLTRVDPQQ